MHFSFPILLSPAGVHKTAQQTLAFRRLPTMFRVPLHGLYETLFRQVNSFDQPIRSHCLGMQRRSQPFNALMMAAVHRQRTGAV